MPPHALVNATDHHHKQQTNSTAAEAMIERIDSVLSGISSPFHARHPTSKILTLTNSDMNMSITTSPYFGRPEFSPVSSSHLGGRSGKSAWGVVVLHWMKIILQFYLFISGLDTEFARFRSITQRSVSLLRITKPYSLPEDVALVDIEYIGALFLSPPSTPVPTH
jgi:hypothetical protein